MYVHQPVAPTELQISPSLKVVLLIATVGTLLSGLLPAWLLDFAAGSLPQGIG